MGVAWELHGKRGLPFKIACRIYDTFYISIYKPEMSKKKIGANMKCASLRKIHSSDIHDKMDGNYNKFF
jgi:hypothetical protein